jgi:predicted XRE-type DNA-binding protein
MLTCGSRPLAADSQATPDGPAGEACDRRYKSVRNGLRPQRKMPLAVGYPKQVYFKLEGRGALFDMPQVYATTHRASNRSRTRARRPSLVEFAPPRSVGPSHRGPVRSGARGSSPKYLLATQINRLLDAQQMSQIVAAQRLGISQSKVSAIRNYKLHGISLERLLQALVALDQRVAIVVKPRGAAAAGAVSVMI